MAGITQTIPNYTGGISEQPDQLKVPGQVKDTVNAIPDIVHGLYKRPGAKRIGTTPLANVQSNGSWFHYYRDETEGSYIGQVAADGKVRMWCCNDIFNSSGTKVNSAGDEIFVHYHTVSGAYTQSNYNGSDSNHTSITNYLSASNTEDVQALTINDTTFLNNRDTDVATTGTTGGRPHKNFAYIELMRTENGRQYGLNIYDSDSTTNLSRATRIKLGSDSLDEGDGSGTCPGIGTQVFSVTLGNGSGDSSANAKNLIFRINTLGQQGRKSDSDTSPTGTNYRCSYNREVTLLHGGEGWDTNDTTGNVSLTQAATAYNYNIEVTDHETTAVKANVAMVRPAPTPFDADTAVTVDTILGGITAELSGKTVNGNALNYEIIGNGIYLYTAADADDFNGEVVDQDLMRVMQTEINDVTKLPVQCKHGAIVKISNTRMSDEDDYYVQFNGENGKSGPGQWTEVAEPGIVKSLDATTMPHVLQRQSISGTNPVIFLAKKYEWEDRKVGDDVTNPIPSFVGEKINRVLFFRNRLVLLAGENVVTSRPGSIAKPNFWSDSALTVSAVDPIDISCASTYPSALFDAIEINTGLLCFSTNAQFLLSSDDTIMNPDTAKLRAVSWFNYNKVIPPISLGQTTGYIDNSNKYSRFMEMANIVREGEPAVVNTSKVVPTLLPKDIDLFTNSKENNIVLFGKTDSDTVIGFRYLNQADKRLQAAWFKWKFNNPLKYHFCIEDSYYLIDTDNFLQKVNLIQADADPSIDQDNTNYLIHLDNYTTVSGGTFASATNKTTFTNQSDWIDQVTSPNGKLVVVDTDPSTTREGRYAECTVINNDDFTIPGDWSREVTSITVTNGGSGYTSAPTVTISGGGGSAATATATIESGAVTAVTINNNGYNFTSVPTVAFSGGGGSSAAATAAIHTGEFNIGYLYDYQVDFPRFYLQKTSDDSVSSDINSKLTVHRMKLNFGKIGLYETTLTRVGKAAYTEIYESTDLDEYDASDAPYLDEKIKDIPVYERNLNVDVTLKSSHPAPATLRSMSSEGDWSPMHYRRV